MKLYYYQDDMANFGDDLNAWLWPKILSDVLDDDASHLMLGIGSILNHKLPIAEKYTVVGSGWGYGQAPNIDDNWNVVCVRGKISCEALGIDPNLGIIDPAYLLQDYIKEPVEKKYKVSLIPHALSLEIGLWQDICDQLNIHLIDPRTVDIEHFVNEVRSSEKILTEAMHGAIISDCFGVPWLGYSAYDFINCVKWNDWLSVLNHEVMLHPVDSLYKGYEDFNTIGLFKNEVKLVLKSCGLWSDKWYKPTQRKSTQVVNDKICNQLSSLIANGDFFCSDRALVMQQLEKLRAAIDTLRK
jgi:hypothetical protein